MLRTARPIRETLLLLLPLYLLSGCAGQVPKAPEEPPAAPEITESYLLDHRITLPLPGGKETLVSTLPYEIVNFDESYRLRLVAQLPADRDDMNGTDKAPHCYLWFERKAKNWRDFTRVYAVQFSPLTLEPHFSTIRQGTFYKEYTVDFSRRQLVSVQHEGLELLLVNPQNITSTITLPALYVRAFLKMVPLPAR